MKKNLECECAVESKLECECAFESKLECVSDEKVEYAFEAEKC
jgi:hypothetical protein